VHTFSQQALGVLSTCFSTYSSQNSRWKKNTSHFQHYVSPHLINQIFKKKLSCQLTDCLLQDARVTHMIFVQYANPCSCMYFWHGIYPTCTSFSGASVLRKVRDIKDYAPSASQLIVLWLSIPGSVLQGSSF